MTISFDVTPEQEALIEKIAERADREVFSRPYAGNQSQLDTIMDLSATIAQGVPLKLEELLAADEFVSSGYRNLTWINVELGDASYIARNIHGNSVGEITTY